VETLEAIASRRSVRHWTEEDVPEGILLKILEAGRSAPSPLNSQPWHFVVVRDKGSIGKLMRYANHGTFLTHARAIIVVSVEKNAKVDEWLAGLEQHLYSAACALQNMWLAAWGLGLGGCWVSLDEPKAGKLLGMPADQKVVGCLALGYSGEGERAATPKKMLAEMVSYEKYGAKGGRE